VFYIHLFLLRLDVSLNYTFGIWFAFPKLFPLTMEWRFRMRALRFHNFGAVSSVLKIEEIPTPIAQDGELLVKVKAAAINPSDVKNVGGAFKQTTLPRTPGRDFSGIVVSKGEREGEEVWGTGPGLGITRDGAHAEYVSVRSGFVATKPKRLSVEQAAEIGVPFTTAWAAVIEAGQLKAGETILIIGAGGAVGGAAVQIANWKQARVLAAGRSSDAVPGTEAVINTAKEDLPQRAHELTGGKGVDVVFDVVGGPMFEPALRSLRVGGRQVAIASTGGSRVSFDLVEFYHNRAHLIGVDSNKFEASELRMIMAELNRGFEAGALKASDGERVPFDRSIASYERIAAQTGTPKQILTF
jgi:NADPH:quinone reductase-like Zn-dependent oxidoreductase